MQATSYTSSWAAAATHHARKLQLHQLGLAIVDDESRIVGCKFFGSLPDTESSDC